MKRRCARVASRPDATIAELRARLLAEHGVSASYGTTWATLDRLDLTHTKQIHAAEQGRPDIPEARAAWREQQPYLNPARLVFIDETWAT